MTAFWIWVVIAGGYGALAGSLVYDQKVIDGSALDVHPRWKLMVAWSGVCVLSPIITAGLSLAMAFCWIMLKIEEALST